MAAGKQLSAASACEYLSEVGLCARDYIDREVNSSLSGGELKRIEIATVLARATKLSVFDEPEAGIDLWSFQNLIQVFQRMREKYSIKCVVGITQSRQRHIANRWAAYHRNRQEQRCCIPALLTVPLDDRHQKRRIRNTPGIP